MALVFVFFKYEWFRCQTLSQRPAKRSLRLRPLRICLWRKITKWSQSLWNSVAYSQFVGFVYCFILMYLHWTKLSLWLSGKQTYTHIVYGHVVWGNYMVHRSMTVIHLDRSYRVFKQIVDLWTTSPLAEYMSAILMIDLPIQYSYERFMELVNTRLMCRCYIMCII